MNGKFVDIDDENRNSAKSNFIAINLSQLNSTIVDLKPFDKENLNSLESMSFYNLVLGKTFKIKKDGILIVNNFISENELFDKTDNIIEIYGIDVQMKDFFVAKILKNVDKEIFFVKDVYIIPINDVPEFINKNSDRYYAIDVAFMEHNELINKLFKGKTGLYRIRGAHDPRQEELVKKMISSGGTKYYSISRPNINNRVVSYINDKKLFFNDKIDKKYKEILVKHFNNLELMVAKNTHKMFYSALHDESDVHFFDAIAYGIAIMIFRGDKLLTSPYKFKHENILYINNEKTNNEDFSKSLGQTNEEKKEIITKPKRPIQLIFSAINSKSRW